MLFMQPQYHQIQKHILKLDLLVTTLQVTALDFLYGSSISMTKLGALDARSVAGMVLALNVFLFRSLTSHICAYW